MTTPPGRQKRYQLRKMPKNCYGIKGSWTWYIFLKETHKCIAANQSRFKAIVAAHDFLQDLENNSGQKATT